jgi:hypothetical protein
MGKPFVIVLNMGLPCKSVIQILLLKSLKSLLFRILDVSDMAAGGQGAPLVPAFHQPCFSMTVFIASF